MKIKDLAEPFFTYGKAEKLYAEQTQEKFRDCFRSWLLPHLGEIEVEAASRFDILDFRKAMAEHRLSVARQYSLLMALKLLLKFCRSVLKLPCLDPNEIRLPKRVHKPVEFLTEEEIVRLIAAIPIRTFTGLRTRVLIEVLLSTGMRISEALSLNRDSINAHGEADIIGKGQKARTIFVSPACLKWIKAFLRVRSDNHAALFITTGMSPRRLSRNDMSKTFKNLRIRSAIRKHLTPHLLRHTFCTSLLHAGADITFIKELAGHSDIQTTAHYYLGVDKTSLKNVLMRCQTYGWTQEQQPQSPPLPDRPEIAGAPLWPPRDPGPDNNGRWSQGVHVPGFP